MVASTFELFKIGVGPSSSHTMGPMTAAADFVASLGGELGSVSRIEVRLYGSLALTGKGHATDRAIVLGLSGERPATICPDNADLVVAAVRQSGRLALGGSHEMAFDEACDLLFLQRERLPGHSNGMHFAAYRTDASLVAERTAYSIGGGAVVTADAAVRNDPGEGVWDAPYPFSSSAELLARCDEAGLSIAGLMRRNEESLRSPEQVSEGLSLIRRAMNDCIERGMAQGGILPGGLEVKRRAPTILATLRERQERALADPLSVIDWINLWALAVNEENAAGGRVVTAPTNGAAGIVPAVLRYYERFAPGACNTGAEDFLLTAAAIGSLFKENASISGAEVGCQGEVGVACSMAAAGLAAALGGSPGQVENAAEIGMEHNLGLTCDPVGGLVQVPCIERNAVGSIKAVEAARLALLGDGTHRVSLDQVIETMRKTGLDMSERYKETSLGGLAVNVVEC